MDIPKRHSIDKTDIRRRLPSVDAVLQASDSLLQHWGNSRVGLARPTLLLPQCCKRESDACKTASTEGNLRRISVLSMEWRFGISMPPSYQIINY